MRILVAILAGWLAGAFVPAATAAVADAPAKEDGRVEDTTAAPDTASTDGGRETLPSATQPTRKEQLDALFQTLKDAKNEEAAQAAEASITALWLQSGSDTVDLLMQWTLDAVRDKTYPLALDYLDRILTLKPDYAEAWNTRATVYYLTEDYGRSIADIEKVLALEPRHFGALAGLGTILREIGDEKRALEVYRRALAVDPHLSSVQKAVDDLSEKGAGGRDI